MGKLSTERRKGEAISLTIDDTEVTITFLEIRNGRARVQINAPHNVTVSKAKRVEDAHE